MPAETKKEIGLEIGHVLFIDIVGYSKLLINEQSEQMQKLREIVRATEQFRSAEAAGKLLRLPTGDGGALVFRTGPEAPVLCALEISKELKKHPELRVRMGIHSGPVNEITDLNEQANIAGAGINVAQRVMDCGDAGHILLSRHVAEDLEQYRQWQPYLHDLGECEVKHGVRVSVVNLCTEEVGNSEVPEKFQTPKEVQPAPAIATSDSKPVRRSWSWIAALIIVAALASAAGFYISSRRSGPKTPPSATAPAPAAIPEKSIAVLPFENLSSDKENAYFADGIQDEILTRLSKIAALKVISRTSTQKYKSAPNNLREIGQQLGVANLLEGSVQKIANAVHVDVQLIRAATDEHVWAESYNRKLDDVFGVEGEVASAIADQLNAKLSGTEQKAVAEKPTQNAAAYDAYLRALAVSNVVFDTGWEQGAPLYAEAVRLDPQFALAWAHLAVARSDLFFNGVDPQTNTAAAVKEAADRAMSLQPELGESWVAQGVYQYRVLRDFPRALQSYEEALRRLPNNAFVLEQIAHLERRLGQPEVALKHYQAAAEIDPRNIASLILVSDTLQSLRRYNDARAVLDHVLQFAPGNETAISSIAQSFQGEGRLKEAAETLAKMPADSQGIGPAIFRCLQLYDERKFDEAIVQIQKAPSIIANDPRMLSLLGWCQKLSGKENEARATFIRAAATMKPTPDSAVAVDGRELPAYLALVYVGLGEKENALEQAHRAIADYETDALVKPFAQMALAIAQAHFGDTDSAIAALPHLLEVPNGETPGTLRVNPWWDPLRNDPRFQKLAEQPLSQNPK